MFEALVIILLAVIAFRLVSIQDCNVIPVLIVKKNEVDDYLIENIGLGPAFNIIVLRKEFQNRMRGAWKDPVRIAYLKKDEVRKLILPGQFEEENSGVMFRDIMGREYYTKWVDGQIENRKGRLVNPHYLK